MKISPRTIFFLLSLVVSSLNYLPALAWSGYDYDNKTDIEIGPGNLVRESLIIQFYDSKYDDYHTAQVLFMESDSGGTRLQVKDLDLNKTRIFIMQD